MTGMMVAAVTITRTKYCLNSIPVKALVIMMGETIKKGTFSVASTWGAIVAVAGHG